MRKCLTLAFLALLLCSPAVADGCVQFPYGLPEHFDCNGHAAGSCSLPGPLPAGQCCVQCWTADGCPFAALGPCDNGNGGGGGGQCQGSRCTEGAVTVTEPNHGWFARAWDATKRFLHIK